MDDNNGINNSGTNNPNEHQQGQPQSQFAPSRFGASQFAAPPAPSANPTPAPQPTAAPQASQFSPVPPMPQPQNPQMAEPLPASPLPQFSSVPPMPQTPPPAQGMELGGFSLNDVVAPQPAAQPQPQFSPTPPMMPQQQAQAQPQPMAPPQMQQQYQTPQQPQYQQPQAQQYNQMPPQGQQYQPQAPQYQQQPQMQQQYQQPQYQQQQQRPPLDPMPPPPNPQEVPLNPSADNIEKPVAPDMLNKLPSAPPIVEAPKKKRIGERFIELGLITQDQLNVALHQQKQTGKLLGETLVELGFLGADMLTHFLSEMTGYEQFDHKKTVVDPEALRLIEKKDAVKFRVIPVSISHTRNEVTIAMADPDDIMALDSIKQLLPKGYNVLRQICSPAVLVDAIQKVYGVSTSIEDILRELSGDKNAAKENLDSLTEDQAYAHPIVRLVNAILFEAAKLGASDLHFEPEESFARVRYRIDGDLIAAHTFHKEYWSGICQRLKIVSSMNIADKLTPQDGRFSLNMGGRDADFRVSSLPTVHGENIVLRLLDKNASIVPLEKLDFSEINMHLINKSLSKPEGIILVTGPTGSGKTTTLYSMISAVNTIDVNIMTLEDPVEYSLPNIRQTNIRESTGFTFGEGVKSLLRQDPDIIFIGEVRDEVTAEQALKAAMTGHQVFSTLHANDTFGAIPRLMDLGLKPGMMAGTIIAVFAQRLVRRICPHCKTSYMASREECRLLGVNPEVPLTLYKGAGCKDCSGSGCKGRVAIHEILYMDEEINSIISANGDKSILKKKAVEHGFKSMLDDGVLKLYKGMISFEELRKVANFADRM